jgi:hypothetical protein
MTFQENYKSGGTCTIAVKQWSGRTVQTIKDTTGQGCWSGIKIRGHRKNIVIITAYRVVQKTIEQSGPTTAYYVQQWAVSRQQGIPRPEPRLQFIKDIKIAIKAWKKKDATSS